MKPAALLWCALLAAVALALPTVRAVMVTNPMMAGVADPDVLRVDDEHGQPTYFLTHTVGNGADFPLFVSQDLVSWHQQHEGLFNHSGTPGHSVQMGAYHYCWLWAPEIRPANKIGGFILSFTASRFDKPQTPCPGYDEGSGVFMAYAKTPYGPFYDASNADVFPRPTGASLDPKQCEQKQWLQLPHSTIVDQHDCDSQNGILCNNTMRLDPDVFNDPKTGESWFAYSFYTNSEVVLKPFELTNLGEHVGLVKQSADDPRFVSCNPAEATKVWGANCHDEATLDRLSKYCPRCGEMLSFVKGRLNETMMRGPAIWGVVEGAMLFRRGDLVYLLMSHSAWDSAYYSVMWTAAPTVEELAYTNEKRMVGRFLIPSKDQNFGHGTAVLGPDNEHWYYIHHHLDHSTCNKPGDNCSRDLYISPLNFNADGSIQPVFPAENLHVEIYQPKNTHAAQRIALA